MMYNIRKAMRGFTLIELLVVIAIIGLLASIVLVSLSSARKKARDSRRVGDLRQVQLALELYFDVGSKYPYYPTPAAGTSYSNATLANNAFIGTATTGIGALVPTYLPSLPVDPLNTTPQMYGYIPGDNASPPTNCDASTDSCTKYILVVTLEDVANPALKTSNGLDHGGYAANNGFECDGTGGQAPTTSGIYCVGN